MIAVDVNVLIYAHRRDQVHHEFYRAYLESTISAGEALGLSPLVASGFVRIVTNPRFPNGPSPLSQALSVIESIASAPNCYWINPGPRHWQLTAELCRQCGCTGKLVADAQHAAIALENACAWVTRDRDFEVFTGHGLRLQLLEP